MRLRRRVDQERVRHALRGLPEGMPPSSYGDEIMRLRKVMQRAITELYRGRPDAARRMLSAALAERWWR